MPKDLRWKIVLILLVLVFGLISIYPLQDTLVWSGTVVDVVDNRGEFIERNYEDSGTIHSPFAYYLEKLTFGIFHHRSERYDNEERGEDYTRTIGRREIPVRDIRRDVELRFSGLTLGLDLAGGAEMRYRVISHGGDVKDDAQKIIEIIRKRIDAMGLREPIITTEGADRIHVQLPGQDDYEISRIRNIIESSGNLEFRLVSSNEAILREARHSDEPPAGYTWYDVYDPYGRSEGSERLLISNHTELTGEFIAGTGTSVHPMTREISVTLNFNPEGTRRFYDITAANTGERLAIILDDIRDADGNIIQKGRLYSAPVIRDRIWGQASISGNFTERDARDLQTTLEAGSLPASLMPEEDNRVGPSLGRDSIMAGQRAIAIGFIAVIAFMVLYYRKAGLVANIALLFNLLLVLAALSIYRATLTLPGIAGLILTVGMAVDANVLIFERIREEMEKKGGERLLLAIRDGYSRATVTIVDANLTTLGTALFLYMIGTGPVKGFAATLSLGIIFSMFTAIFVTRVIFEFFVAKGWIHKLGMGKIIGASAYNFLKSAKHAALVSVVLFAVGVSVFFSAGDDKYDIDFRPGTMMHVVAQPGVTDANMREALVALPDVTVQPITTREGVSEYIIKTTARGETTFLGTPDRLPTEGATPLYRVRVLTDRARSADEISATLASLGHGNVEVTTEESREGTIFAISINASMASHAQNAIREAFDALSVRAEVAGMLEGKLVEDGFLKSEVSEGIVRMRVNFGSPVAVADVRRKLADEGYTDVVVSVAGNEEAASGTTLEIQARAKAGDPDMLRTMLAQEFNIPEAFRSTRSVGPHAASGLRTRAFFAIVLALIFVVGYIWFRFELQYGFAAVLALVHDVGITIGLLTLLGIPFNLTIIAGILTIIGYSLNDTIVVFDRVRENLNIMRRERFDKLVNISINQTLSRTLLTSTTTLVAVLALWIFGGGVIRHFAITLLIGVFVGTYSSIFVASPFLVFLHKRTEAKRQGAVSTTAATSKS